MIIIYVTDGYEEINVRDTDMKKTRMKFLVKTVGQCLFYDLKSSINCRNLEELQYKKYAHSICHRVRGNSNNNRHSRNGKKICAMIKIIMIITISTINMPIRIKKRIR